MTDRSLTIGSNQSAAYTGYFPRDAAGGPALLVLQEIYGVNQEVRRVADFYAERGFSVLAPDLSWRVAPNLSFDYADRDAAREAVGRLAVADIVADIHAAAEALRARGSAHDKLGILAFGWGAQHALAAAQAGGFDAVASYYPGNLDNHVETARSIHAPLLFHFSAIDFRTPPKLRTAFRQALAERDDVEIYTYAHADHGFANVSRPEYEAKAAALADERALGFLSRSLAADR